MLRHAWIRWGALLLVLVWVPLASAVVAEPPHVLLERGYTRLLQARLATVSETRERLLRAAIAAFKGAYQNAGPSTQARALVGAAQAYLLVQSPRRTFPFLWQATPLQRAEKHLQQALFLQPDSAAAALLLGVVYWRQAATVSTPQADVRARSRHYLEQAATLGVPVRLTATPPLLGEPAPGYGVDDSLLLLAYMDTRGNSKADDLVLIYRPVESPHVFGVVIIDKQPYPLIAEAFTGALTAGSVLEAMSVVPRPGGVPVLALRFQHAARHAETRFVWDGTRFVLLPP